MKNIILFIPILLLLVSCGSSQKEKQEIATLTCNIMAESRGMDASLRIKEINAARIEIGEDRYLDTDEKIKESFEYGLCEELVLNNDYQNKLLEAKKEEAELRRQQLAQIEADKAEKEAKRKEMQEKWRTAIASHFKEVKINNALDKVELDFSFVRKTVGMWRLVFWVSCTEEVHGFHKGIKILFKDNIGTLTSRNTEENRENSGRKNCDRFGGKTPVIFDAWQLQNPDLIKSLNDLCPSGCDEEDISSLDKVVAEINLLIIGVSRLDPPKDFIFNMPDVYGDMLDEPYLLKRLR